MRTIIKSKKIKLSPGLKTYLEEKLIRQTQKVLGASEGELPLLEIEFSRTTSHHHKGNVWRAEANLTLGRRVLRAEQVGEGPHEVIDLVEEELRREIKSFRGKGRTKEIRGARKLKRMMRRGKKPL